MSLIKPAVAAIALALCFAPTIASASQEARGDMRMHHQHAHKMMHEKMKGMSAEERKVVHQRWRACSAEARSQKLRGQERKAFTNQCRMHALG